MTTADDPGPQDCAELCSLRAAINAANESEEGGEIRFAIAGPTVIRPAAQLPPLRAANISLDARTQSGWSESAPPIVYLDGQQAGDAAGITINGPNIALRGLAVGGFARYGIGIIGAGAQAALVEQNWLGMTPDGRAAAPNRLSGIAVLGGATRARIAQNRIAGNSAGNSAAARTGHGVVVGGGAVRGVEVAQNIIGLDAAGRVLANDDGVLVVDGAQADIRANLICGSLVAGVEYRDTRAGGSVDGNRIGVTPQGAAAGNDVGVFLGQGVSGVSVGARERNIIAANRVGIAVEQGAREILLQGNWLGLTPAPDSDALADARAAPNRERAISIIAGASFVRVTANQVLAGERGIVIAGADTSRVSLQRNAVASQGAALTGIEARQAADLRIGGDRGLGNSVRGVATAVLLAEIEEADISHNRIGVEFAEVGFPAAPDTGVGIALAQGARAARIGENLIGGVAGPGVRVSGAQTRDNLIIRNIFGAIGGLDIEVGAEVDAPPPPTLLSYSVERTSSVQLRSTIRGRGEPGTTVELYLQGGTVIGSLARAPVDDDGAFEAVSLLLPQGEIRAVAVGRWGSGQTSEFSEPFSTPARQPIAAGGLQWIAVEGAERPIEQALAPLLAGLDAAWRWDPNAARWLGWSPDIPSALNSLQTARPGDVLAVALRDGAPKEYISSEQAGAAEAAAQLRAGINLVSWNGPWTSALEALERLNAAQPGLLSIVEQWDGRRWQVIWPRVAGAWDPGRWGAPALRLRATRNALWPQTR